MILCCGEALIDFLPAKTADGAAAFQPFIGGSVYNVAIALGRLGVDAGYFGGLSNDFFGNMLVRELNDSNVDIALVQTSSLPSTLAFVNFNDGQPEYVFLDEGSAGRMLGIDRLPEIPETVNALHFGSISLINDPAASTFAQLAQTAVGKHIISIDPNIRPSIVTDRKSYLQRLENMISAADIIKISNEDLDWLTPDIPLEDCVWNWLDAGSALVVVTKADEGAIAFTRELVIEQDATKTKVSDTIGAGDAFMAGLLASLNDQGLLQKEKLSTLDRNAIEIALAFAIRAAAITVSRTGANPPWKHEL